MTQTQSPIFSKSYDFLLWLLNHTEKFPKSERFRLARRLEDTAFKLYDLLLESTRPGRAAQKLQEADLELDKLRLCVRPLSIGFHARICKVAAQSENFASALGKRAPVVPVMPDFLAWQI